MVTRSSSSASLMQRFLSDFKTYVMATGKRAATFVITGT
jgi:hypothetical protein